MSTGYHDTLVYRLAQILINQGEKLDPADLAETNVRLDKTDLIHRRRHWSDVDRVRYATLERHNWFNNRRLLQSISAVPSSEKELAYYRRVGESIRATCHDQNSPRGGRGATI